MGFFIKQVNAILMIQNPYLAFKIYEIPADSAYDMWYHSGDVMP